VAFLIPALMTPIDLLLRRNHFNVW